MQRRGFTLAEVLVVSIVGLLLATMAWPAYRGQLQRAARSEAIEALQRLQLAQERHRETFGLYAGELKTVGLGAATSGGRYHLALTPTGAESYRAMAMVRIGSAQESDRDCAAITIDVRQGFATLGPDGRCWNR